MENTYTEKHHINTVFQLNIPIEDGKVPISVLFKGLKYVVLKKPPFINQPLTEGFYIKYKHEVEGSITKSVEIYNTDYLVIDSEDEIEVVKEDVFLECFQKIKTVECQSK